MDFYEAHKSQRDKFEIITIHDPRATSFQMLDEKMADLSKNKWNGRKLPFPIILDTSGATLRAWGINAFPTAVLIDPEGKMVAKNHWGIDDQLEEELKKLKK